jgi:hypothetical protein
MNQQPRRFSYEEAHNLAFVDYPGRRVLYIWVKAGKLYVESFNAATLWELIRESVVRVEMGRCQFASVDKASNAVHLYMRGGAVVLWGGEQE